MKKYSPGILIKALTLSMVFAVVPAYAGKGEKLKLAIDACSGKSAGDACSLKVKDKDVDGTCRASKRAEGKVICVPNPSQQAYDACKDKAEGAECSFENRREKKVTGACRKDQKDEGKLFCSRKKAD